MNRAVAAIGLLVGIAALVLQFCLAIPASMVAGRSLGGSVLFYFGFFTILTNIGLVLVWLSELFALPALHRFRRATVRAGLAAAIAFVMIFYHVMLAKIWAPQGLFKLADLTLHYALPSLYLLWWVALAAHRRLEWRAVPWMLVYPVLYVAWAMARGAVVGEYPYPVLEVGRLGYPAVLANIALLLALFTLLCAAVVALDRRLPGSVDVPG